LACQHDRVGECCRRIEISEEPFLTAEPAENELALLTTCAASHPSQFKQHVCIKGGKTSCLTNSVLVTGIGHGAVCTRRREGRITSLLYVAQSDRSIYGYGAAMGLCADAATNLNDRSCGRRPSASFDIDGDEVHYRTDRWTKTKQNKNWPSVLRRPPAQRKLPPSRNMFAVRLLPCDFVTSISDASQNVSYTLGITTRPSLSGQNFVSSQFSPMRFRPSRRLSWCIRSSRRDTQSCVMNHFTLLTRYRCIIHRKAIKEAQSQTGWLETCSRTIAHDGGKGTFSSTSLVPFSQVA